MADKRISQLVDRGTVANNDVVPIVVSGATTTNKATISSIQTFMQGNLDLGVTSVGITLGSSGTDVSVSGSPITSSGNITINIPTASATNRGLLSSANWTTFNNKVSSVGLSMPSAFAVANSPITGSGTIAVTGAGTVAQYIRGDGSLADFPSGGGGGSSVNYYLNGSVSQGTIGGIAYYEMNKVPVLGAGTDFVAIADGYLASFITDAGDPGLLEIPAGNWNFETYFSASSGGGSPSFYIELYKVNSGGTATLIASNSATPELISFGTSISPYFSPLAVPTTVLTVTDRLAVRYYVTHSGRTITLHTENSHLCQIITTFTTGLTALNGLTAQVQNFATGTSGTDFAISSSVSTHTFNLPTASATNRGALSSSDWTTFNNKQAAGNYVTTDTTQSITGVKTFDTGSLILAAAGTANSTHLRNSAGDSTSVGGSNVFGFNSGNNIYVSTQSKGGFILAFNNSVSNRQYDLPNASGTIALTSDIPSLAGYVTLATTQTITGEKTFDSTTSTFAAFNSTNANGGTLTFRRSGTNVGHIGNSGVLGVGILDDLEVRSGIGKGLHLKTDGGKLTLSAGGSVTLDGALNGTSASFSGTINSTITNNLVLSNNSSTTQYVYTSLANSIGNARYGVDNSSGGGLGTGTSPNSAVFGNAGNADVDITTNNISRLKIDSTGAATFSSSVTAGGALRVSGGGTFTQGELEFTSTASGGQLGIFTNQPSSTTMFFDHRATGNTGQFIFRNGTGGANTLLSIASNGEATFGSSVKVSSTNFFRYDGDTGIVGSATAITGGTASQLGIRAASDILFATNGANERMRITSDAYLRMASGTGGIQFNGDTAAANALDDYEEGTFTPTMTFGGGSTGITYFDRIGNYTKVGRHITCTIYLALTSKGSSTGNAQITGLPFAASGANRGTATAGSIRFVNIIFVGQLAIQGQQSGTVIDFGQTTELGVGSTLTNSNFSDSSEMFITISYFAAS